MNPEFTITKDGSHTLFVKDINEHYHSIHGAIAESRHVFIEAGLLSCKQNKINILEVGFGTGLNALLTLINISKFEIINYQGIELYPLEEKIWKKLNYCFCIDTSKEIEEKFLNMHRCKWNKKIEIASGFIFLKILADIKTYNFTDKYDLIYFDAFAPNKQPELWTKIIFKKLSDAMNPNAILTTYSAKGSVKRSLNAVGCQVELLPGPPGKREMIRAVKIC